MFSDMVLRYGNTIDMIRIPGWGQPILEFLDFETLAPALHALHRSTFFVTIEPLNILYGIAAPPNALAII